MESTGADDTTDGYDTIDWLVKNFPRSNGKVGMIGSSYEGYTVQTALLHPHPALKAAVPESPMTDGWMGDDWFHYGAFRQTNLDYFLSQTTLRGAGKHGVLTQPTTTTQATSRQAQPETWPAFSAKSSCPTGRP